MNGLFSDLQIMEVSEWSEDRVVAEASGTCRKTTMVLDRESEQVTQTEVLNKSLWQELVPLLSTHDITWHKVPGHVGIKGNERADTIASDFAEHGTFALYSGPLSEYGFDISDTSYNEAKAQARSDARKRSTQKAHSYVSAVNGDVRTHRTWSECEARVKGTKGARFKKSLNATNEHEIIEEFSG